jgi:hypothetical protein
MKTIFTLLLAFFIQSTVFAQVSTLTSKVTNDRVDLKWTTASESNISHFVVEKSTDGQNFRDAGIVFAYGNTTETVNYPFYEKNVKGNQQGVVYYRVSQISNDGTVTSAETITVSLNK